MAEYNWLSCSKCQISYLNDVTYQHYCEDIFDPINIGTTSYYIQCQYPKCFAAITARYYNPFCVDHELDNIYFNGDNPMMRLYRISLKSTCILVRDNPCKEYKKYPWDFQLNWKSGIYFARRKIGVVVTTSDQCIIVKHSSSGPQICVYELIAPHILHYMRNINEIQDLLPILKLDVNSLRKGTYFNNIPRDLYAIIDEYTIGLGN